VGYSHPKHDDCRSETPRGVAGGPAERQLLVRLLPEKPKRRPQVHQITKAMRTSPLRPTLSWNELKRLTREP
jgi:hypothetical protein